MNMSPRVVLTAIAAAALLATMAQADARPRKRAYVRYVEGERAITVTRRSFLDSGVVVPVGSRNAYVQEILRYERPPLANTSPGVLWRPDPGRIEPF